MAITFTLVQQDEDGAVNPSAPSLGVAPTEGNLLVVIAGERSGSAFSAFTGLGAFNTGVGFDNEIGDGGARICGVIKAMRAGAGADQALSIDNGTANNIWGVYAEFAPSEAITAITDRGSSSDGTGLGSTSPQNTGNTASLSAADLVVITAGVFRPGSNTLTAITYDNTPDLTDNFFVGASGNVAIGYGLKDDLAGGVYETDVSWDGTGHEGMALLTVVEAVTAVAGANPHGPLGHPFHGPFAGPVA